MPFKKIFEYHLNKSLLILSWFKFNKYIDLWIKMKRLKKVCMYLNRTSVQSNFFLFRPRFFLPQREQQQWRVWRIKSTQDWVMSELIGVYRRIWSFNVQPKPQDTKLLFSSGRKYSDRHITSGGNLAVTDISKYFSKYVYSNN